MKQLTENFPVIPSGFSNLQRDIQLEHQKDINCYLMAANNCENSSHHLINSEQGLKIPYIRLLLEKNQPADYRIRAEVVSLSSPQVNSLFLL